jgi:methionyl-tRNA synthetase
MSKTRGNVMDPFPLIEEYGADPFRFYCLREVSFGQDGMVSEEGFKARYNSELANELGNLVSRTTSMIAKYRGGAVPAPPPGYADPPECTLVHPGSPLAVEATATIAAARTQLEEMDLSAALETVWMFVRRLNRYVEEQAPWKLAKAAAAEGAPGLAARAELDATLWDLAEGLRLLSVLLHPFIPETAGAIRERLGLSAARAAEGGAAVEGAGLGATASGAAAPSGAAPGPTAAGAAPTAAPNWAEACWGLLPTGLVVTTGAPLFPRIEQ